LAQAGRQVALIDDCDYEQWKVGESLPGAAIRLLHRLGISSLEELVGSENYKACMANVSAWGTDHWTYKDAIHSPEGGGWHLMRHEFDKALKEQALAAGAVHHSARVYNSVQKGDKSFLLELKGASVNSQLDAQFLIDASGRSAVVSRRMGTERERMEQQMAAYTWLKPMDGDTDNTTRVKSVSQGWWYTSRLPNGYRVLSYQGNADIVGQMSKDPQSFLEACNATDILPTQRLLCTEHLSRGIHTHDAGISRLLQPYGEGWLAMGDAALSFDPLSSQGIFFSLYSAVRGVEASLDGSDAAFEKYAKQVRSVFDGNIRGRKEFYGAIA